MKKPLILVTGGNAYDHQFHKKSIMLNKTYTSAVVAAGGIPILWADNEVVEDYVNLVDGCICTGTQEYVPSPTLSLSGRHNERVRLEEELMKAFMAAKKPLLGICQGMQQINVACGGDLHKNFRLTYGVEHNRTAHTVDTVEGSFIHRLFGTGFVVNSLHNVKVDHLAPGLKVTATSPDGVIEAYEHETLPVYAFQWHPERMRGDFPEPPVCPNMENIFTEFINMCRK